MWSALSGLPPPRPAAEDGGNTSKATEGPVVVRTGAPTRQKNCEGFQGAAACVVSHTNGDCASSGEKPRDGASGSSEADAWKKFERRCKATPLFHGTVLIEGFPAAQHETSAENPSSLPRTISEPTWNVYWKSYSDRYASYIDTVQEYLKRDENTGSQRRVVIAAQLATEPHMELLMCKLTENARFFGAQECASREGNIITLQFTCRRSAELYAMWAASMTPVELIGGAVLPEHAGNQARLVVCLAAQDATKLTATLGLGENVVLSTAFVEGLFKGIFDAHSVSYKAGSFLIAFGSPQEAKLALHSLQRSLIDIFGLTLGFVGSTADTCNALTQVKAQRW